jgi:membrane protein YqaA with SNARE-associated domain
MGAVIGDVLPLAIGIAISPIPIIAAILMLFSPRATSTSTGFLLGWILGSWLPRPSSRRWRAR